MNFIKSNSLRNKLTQSTVQAMLATGLMLPVAPASAVDFAASGGTGGKGGDTLMQSNTNTTTAGDIGSTGSAGGTGGAGGNSGRNANNGPGETGQTGSKGGTGVLAIPHAEVGQLTLTGGAGGAGGTGRNENQSLSPGGGGGGGGGASISITPSTGSIRVTGNFTLTAGRGGEGGNQEDTFSGAGGKGGASTQGGEGGKGGVNISSDAGGGGGGGGGGNATFTATGAVQVGGTLTVSSGVKGIDGTGTGGGNGGGAGGAGGDVAFRADTLKANAIILKKQDGALTFRLNSLDVTGSDTTISASATLASDVDFGAIHLGGGRTLNVSGAATTTYRFNTFNVHAENARVTGNLSLAGRNLNFSLLPTLSKGESMLKVTGNADVTGALVGLSPPLIGLKGGSDQRDMLSLLTTTGTLTGTPGNEGTRFDGLQGVTVAYDYALETDNAKREMRLRALAVKAAPQAKALSEGLLSGVALMNQGVDLSIERGMRLAVASAGRQTGYSAFGAVAAGHSRYESGSHINMDGASLILGAAAGQDFAAGRLTLGAFAEYGRGDYDTHNSFGAARFSFKRTARIKGDGNTRYAGGGLLAHYTGNNGYYAEATLRAGRVKTDFSSSDLIDYLGQRAEYDVDMSYYGAHAGVGHIWSFGENQALDVYGKYLWLRQTGERTTLSTGDDIRFEDTDSERLRLGARLTWTVAQAWQTHMGLAYEHEFNSKARATTNTIGGALAIDAPELKGGVGIGEIGLSMQQGRHFPVSLGLGLQGYLGKREGITGSIHMNWDF
ncbi:MAG: autotransporter outer membrane beta-barrel domain-containing protein [Zoogloeaceae bacterium]|nr:autotransporter outer membrane beta-barrel domain-containing protein [Zoogloeaceae bacterium]